MRPSTLVIDFVNGTMLWGNTEPYSERDLSIGSERDCRWLTETLIRLHAAT